MSLRNFVAIFGFVITSLVFSQEKQITLQDIWTGQFRTEGMQALHSMKNGQQYSVLNFDRETRTTSIDIYDYKTSEKVKTLVSSAAIDELQYFSDYTFNSDESKLILTTKSLPVFRHSTLGEYYIYDVASKKVTKVSDHLVQEPTLSPDGTKVAYGFENNLYVKHIASGAVEQITLDGEKNKIINGITDWVYEEEFAFVRAFDWNADSNQIAFIKFDESEVPEFSMDVYGADLYQTQHVFKYPKAGEANSKVSLHLYDLDSKKQIELSEDKPEDFYIPRIKWTNDANVLSVQFMNRHQNELDLILFDTKNKSMSKVLAEKDKAYYRHNR